MKTFKIIIFTLIIPFLINPASSQENKDSVLKEINNQVWKPFLKSYATSNAELLNSLHTKNTVRANLNRGSLVRGESFHQSQLDRMKQNKTNGRSTDMEFRFDHRVHDDVSGFEIGYYKILPVPNPDNRPPYYGKFYVMLRKVDGKWLIDLDADHSSDEEAFNKAKPME